MHMRNRESDPSIFHRDKEQKEPLNKRYQVCRSCREFLGQSKPSDMSRAPTNCQEISFTKKLTEMKKLIQVKKITREERELKKVE